MRIPNFVALSALSLAACGPPDLRASRELQASSVRWKEQGLRDYRFDYVVSCFDCGPRGVPLAITVSDGVVSEVKRKDTGAVLPANESGPVPSVDDLFKKLEKASREAEVWTARYDEVLGYPVEVSIDWQKQTADDESTEQLSNLVPK